MKSALQSFQEEQVSKLKADTIQLGKLRVQEIQYLDIASYGTAEMTRHTLQTIAFFH